MSSGGSACFRSASLGFAAVANNPRKHGTHARRVSRRLIARQINEAKRELHRVTDLPTKLGWHKKVKELEKARQEKRRTLFEAQDKIDAEKDGLISDIEARLKQETAEEAIFTIHWSVR